MLPFRFEDVDKVAVDALITNAVREGRSIEYKLELPGGTDDPKKEFLADVSSFANAAGGDILYGIDEIRDDNNKTTGLPGNAQGLQGLNVDEAIRRLDSMIRDGIKPPIAGVRIKPIDGFPNGPVLLIRIPKSWRAPHMATFKMSPRFHSRNSAGKYPLDITDIRSAFALSESLPQRVQAFRDERVARIIAGETPASLPSGARIILHLLPIAALDRTSLIDPVAVCNGSPFSPLHSHGGYGHYNLDGVLFTTGSRPCSGYLQVFRTGALEAVDYGMVEVNDPKQPKTIPTELFEGELIKASKRYVNALAQFEVYPPCFLMLTLTGVKGYFLATGRPFDHHAFDRDTLFLPEVLIEDASFDSGRVLKPLLDTFWQSVGFSGSPNYDEAGNWKNPR